MYVYCAYSCMGQCGACVEGRDDGTVYVCGSHQRDVVYLAAKKEYDNIFKIN